MTITNTTTRSSGICAALLRSTLCLLLLASASPLLAGHYLPPAGSPLARKTHPRLYLTAEDLPGLRQRILTYYQAEFQNYVNALDEAFDKSPASKADNMLFMDSENYAFLYLIDPSQMPGIRFGHSREQYGRKAIAHAMVSKDMDRGDSHSSAKPQSSNGGYHNLSLAVVYDWTHPLLSLQEKQALADGLFRLYQQRDDDANPGVKQKLSNKITGYVHHGSAGALALWGDELGAGYDSKVQEMMDFFNAVFLERTLETGDHVFKGPGWSEGASYYFLGITNVSFLAGAASSALGRNLFYETDILRRNILYILYNTLPLKLRGNYYMSRHDTNGLQALLDHDISRILVISAGALREADPDMAGLAKWMLTDGGLGIAVKDYKYYSPRIDDLFFQFIWGEKGITPKSPERLDLPLGLKLGLGEIVMKSSFNKESSTHIIFWAPDLWYSPHADKDLASFTIYKYGSLALDSGNGKNEDDFPRGDATSQAVFHNILGLYDPGQNDNGHNFYDFDFSPESSADHWQDEEFGPNGRNRVGKLLGFDTTPEYDYADYDYTRSYDESRCTFARRRVAYLRGEENNEFLVIHDVLKSPQEKRFLLHTAFEPVIDGDIVTVTNNYDRAHGRMFVKSVLPAHKEILKIGGEGKWFVDADWKVIDSRGPYVDWGAYWTGSYRFEIRSQDKEFLTVIQIGDSKTLTAIRPVEKITTTNYSGVLIDGRRFVLSSRPENPLRKAIYRLTGNRNIVHLVAGLIPKSRAKVYKNGNLLNETETSDAGVVSFRDNPHGTSTYKVVAGGSLAVETPSQPVPEGFALYQNHPNPFSPTRGLSGVAHSQTVIEYHLAEPGPVVLQVFDMNGRQVRTLVDAQQTRGDYRVSWNGRTANGQMVPTGIYLYRLQFQEFVATRKLVVLNH